MTITEEEQALYYDTVKIHLMALQLLAEKNLLRFETLDLGQSVYRSQVPEKDSTSVIYTESWDMSRLIVAMISPQVRESKVNIRQIGPEIQRASHVPMKSIAVSQWFSHVDAWPGGWLLRRHDRLEIKITWNGIEKPGDLVLVYLMMMR